jgi:3-oxoadipate enol-lactonase
VSRSTTRGLLAAATAGIVVVWIRRRRRGPVAPSTTHRISWVGRRLNPYRDLPDEGLVLPALPPGEVANVPGRGEMFFRRVQRQGDGLPLLLLHGWMASADLNWSTLYGPLAERFALVAPDHRGHGRGIRGPEPFRLEDCADDAAALLRHLGIPRAIVVGYSMGGPIALLVARRHPDLTAGLVLEATALRWSASHRDRLGWRLLGLVGFLLRWPTGRVALVRLLGPVTDVPPELLAYRAWAEGEFRRADPAEMVEAGRATAEFDGESFAAAIHVPAAVVVTTRDRLVPPERQRDLARALGARVFQFPGDHSAVAMQAEAFAELTVRAVEAVEADVAAREGVASEAAGRS